MENMDEKERLALQASVLMARRFPRDPVRATDRILQACARPGLAEKASYKQQAIATPEQIEKLITAFAEFGVSREMLNRRLGASIEKATAAQIVPLKRVYASLRDGMGKVEDFFSAPEKPSILNEKQRAPKNEGKPKVQSAKSTPEPWPVDDSDPEIEGVF